MAPKSDEITWRKTGDQKWGFWCCLEADQKPPEPMADIYRLIHLIMIECAMKGTFFAGEFIGGEIRFAGEVYTSAKKKDRTEALIDQFEVALDELAGSGFQGALQFWLDLRVRPT